MSTVTVSPLASPIRAADDLVMKWAVYGPGSEFQLFRRKVDATLYASIRRKVETDREAVGIYSRT